MTIDAGLKPEGAPERSPIAGAGAPSGVGAEPKRYSVQRKMAVVARLLRGEPLEHRFLAGGLKRNLVFALRGRARPAGFAGLEAIDAPPAGMAPHRMARGRKRADEILAFDPARRHAPRHSRRHGQNALAHRARLRGTQKRARPRPFRGAKLARIPPSRHPLHRRLRFSHPRTSGDSPLRPPAAPNISPILASQTPRRRQSDPNGISKIQPRNG